jgi:hypothetical protein
LIGVFSGRVADRCAVAFLLAALVLVGPIFRDHGVTWDESGLRDYGRMLVDWYASGFTDGRAFEFANLRYYGGGFDIVATLLQPLMPFGVYETRHLMGGLIGILGLALAWRIGRHLGGPLAGLLSLLLLGTLPSWWGPSPHGSGCSTSGHGLICGARCGWVSRSGSRSGCGLVGSSLSSTSPSPWSRLS